MAEPMAIEIEELHKSFGDKDVLNGVNLRIPSGQITTIIGCSGVGKSVLLKHFIGLLQPDRGRVLVHGQDVTAARGQGLKEIRRKFGLLFQGGALFDSMTVGDNVAFPLVEHTTLDRKTIRQRVARGLEELGLSGVEKMAPAELSGGMRKRVALARALILEPEILLYDEPTSGLDPVTCTQVNALICDTHARHKMTGVIISHDMASTFRISHRVAVLDEGVIATDGRVDEVLDNPHPALQRMLESASVPPVHGSPLPSPN